MSEIIYYRIANVILKENIPEKVLKAGVFRKNIEDFELYKNSKDEVDMEELIRLENRDKDIFEIVLAGIIGRYTGSVFQKSAVPQFFRKKKFLILNRDVVRLIWKTFRRLNDAVLNKLKEKLGEVPEWILNRSFDATKADLIKVNNIFKNDEFFILEGNEQQMTVEILKSTIKLQKEFFGLKVRIEQRNEDELFFIIMTEIH